MQRGLLRAQALASDQQPTIGHAPQNHPRLVAIAELNGGEHRLRRLRPFQFWQCDVLRIAQHRSVRFEAHVERAAAVAFDTAPWQTRAHVVRPAREEQERDRLLAAADQVAVDLVQKAARQRHVDARAEQHQDQAENEDVPADQAPADAREECLHEPQSLMV